MSERNNKGQFEPGHKGLGRNPERQEARRELKALIGGLLIDEFDHFCETMQNLAGRDPKAFCQIYVDLLAYKLPKISAIAFDEDGEKENPATALLREIASYKNNNGN